MKYDIIRYTDDLIAINAKYCIVTDVRHDIDGDFVVCDIYTEEDVQVASGACYFYDGINKNIPFDIPVDSDNES